MKQITKDTPRYDKKNIGSNETNNCKRLEGSGNPKYNF